MEQKGQRQAMAALRTTGITHAEPGAPLVMYVHCTVLCTVQYNDYNKRVGGERNSTLWAGNSTGRSDRRDTGCWLQQVPDTTPVRSGWLSEPGALCKCTVSVGGWYGTVLQKRTHACPDHGVYVYCFLKTSANLLHRDAPEYTFEQLPDRYPTTPKTDDQISDYSEKR